MTRTNYGNGYKFAAIMKRRQGEKQTVTIQRMTKKGWGKPCETQRYGKETDEQVVERLNKLNPGSQFRLAE